ncbi:uncharacterized protein V1513DRAFT_446138 [Lipomyces chichibuensis]|uniref:uncharacterized protein n=1 Tax=Lipomyces chichibuensis TaxID=1546026 RepID=UPI0033435489
MPIFDGNTTLISNIYVVSSHRDAALQLMSVDNPDSYMRECLQYSTNCQACISARTSQQCGWCPFSQVCVPDPGHLGILAAIRDRDICPFSSERYEFRARALGCSVSSITLWSTVISFVVAILFVLIVAAATTWLARRCVLAWVARVLQDEREKKDASEETSIAMRIGDEDRGYQSIATSANSISEVYDAYDEDDDSHAEKTNDVYVYDPQMMPASNERPRVHQSPRLRGYGDMYERYTIAPDREERGRGLFSFSTLSKNVKGLYYKYAG